MVTERWQIANIATPASSSNVIERSGSSHKRLTQLAFYLLIGQATATANIKSDSSTTIEHCTVSAVIDPGHAFINFNCQTVNETLGLYPADTLFMPNGNAKV